MLRADGGQMPHQFGFGHGRQHGRPVLVALAAADDDLVGPEVDVLDAQAAALHDPKPRPIKEVRHEPRGSVEPLDEGAHLVAAQDDGQTFRPFGAHDVVQPRQFHAEHVAVQEQQCA
jgi:hypothetical protein